MSDRAPTNAARKAVHSPDTKVLGGFKPVEGLPYFLVIVVGDVQRWHFQIIVDEESGRYNIAQLDEDFIVSGRCWKDWSGNPDRMPRTVYEGDDPQTYARFQRSV